MMKSKLFLKNIHSGLIAITIACSFASIPSFAATQEFDIDVVEMSKTKFWMPSVFVVEEGDTVVFHPVSKLEGPNNVHGFKIEGYEVEVIADGKGLVSKTEKEVRFKANKPGIFKIKCHLHPAHRGGQFVVLKKQ